MTWAAFELATHAPALTGALTLASGPGDPAARPIVIDLLLVLLAAGLVTMLLQRFRLASIPGYLLAGVVIGPAALGSGSYLPESFGISNTQAIDSISSLAVILLMFTVGLHLDVSSLGRGVVSILTVGVVSTLLVTLLVWPLAMLLGADAPEALVLGMGVSMSSTAVAIRMLQSRREMFRLHGRLAVGISITQDLLSLAFLAAMPVIATWGAAQAGGSGPHAEQHAHGSSGLLTGMIKAWASGAGWPPAAGTALAGLAACLGIAGMIAFGRYVLPRLLHESARERSGESLLVLSSGIALAAAVLAAALGFSPELGAFIAGFMLSSTPFRASLAGQLAPMRDLFMAVFFTSVGLRLDVAQALPLWWVILLAAPLTIVLKFLVIGVCTWAGGATASVSAKAGLALAQSGEFSMVILSVAAAQKAISPEVNNIAIALCVITLMVAPGLFSLADTLRPVWAKIPDAGWLKRSTLRQASAADEASDGPADGSGVGNSDADAGHGHGNGTGAEGTSGRGGGISPRRRKKVIIAGFGVIGRSVADHLAVSKVPFTIVELNAETVATQQRLGRDAIYGDIGNPEVLEAAGVHDADAVFLTVPDDDAVLRACQQIRVLAPHLFIAARTSYLSVAFQVTAAGADDVTIAEVAIAEAMAKRVLARLKQSEEAEQAAAERREARRGALGVSNSTGLPLA